MGGPIRLVPALLVSLLLITPLVSAAPGGPWEAPADADLRDLLHWDSPGVSQCSGLAPFQTHCDIERHDDGGGQYHECVAGPSYTGTIMSELFWPDGSLYRIFCDYVDGELMDKEETDTRPWFSGIGFSHHCSSFDLGTRAAGGAGLWGCVLYHQS